MNAQGLDAHGKEGQMENLDGGAASPLQHGVMCEYSQGICQDGAAILKDGQPMSVESIIEELRQGAKQNTELDKAHELLNGIYESGIKLDEFEEKVREFFGLST